MKYIDTLREGDQVGGVYLCKHLQSATSKAGKEYQNVTLQDKTGSLDCKIWDPNSTGIEEFAPLDYIYVVGEVTSFQNNLQLNIKRVRVARAGEYLPGGLPSGQRKERQDHVRPTDTGSWICVKNKWLKH